MTLIYHNLCFIFRLIFSPLCWMPPLFSHQVGSGCQIFLIWVKYFQTLTTPLISTRLRWCQTTLSVSALVSSWSGSPPSPSTSAPPSSVGPWQPTLTPTCCSLPVLWFRSDQLETPNCPQKSKFPISKYSLVKIQDFPPPLYLSTSHPHILLTGSLPSLHSERSLDFDKSSLYLSDTLSAKTALQRLHYQEPCGRENCRIIYISS